RVYRDRVIDIPLGGAHADGDGESLQHLLDSRSGEMAADDALLVSDGNQFEGGTHLAVGHCMIERGITRLIDPHRITMLFPGLVLGEAHGRDRRMTEYHGGHVVVIDAALRRGAEQAIGEAPAGGYSKWRQGRASRYVADGIDARDTGVLEGIGRDATPDDVALQPGGLGVQAGEVAGA